MCGPRSDVVTNTVCDTMESLFDWNNQKTLCGYQWGRDKIHHHHQNVSTVATTTTTTTTTIATISSPSWTHAHAHKDGGDCGRRRNYTFNESFVIHQQLIQTFRHICMCVFVMQSIIINENSIMSSREIKMRGNRIEQHQKNLTRQKPDSYDSKAMEVTSVFQLSLKLYATNDPYLS